MNGYTKETFAQASDSTKLNILFDCVTTLNKTVQNQANVSCPAQQAACNTRFVKLEHMKKWNAIASAGGGIAGGFLAMITKMMFWK